MGSAEGSRASDNVATSDVPLPDAFSPTSVDLLVECKPAAITEINYGRWR